jgi:hypothetical protein
MKINNISLLLVGFLSGLINASLCYSGSDLGFVIMSGGAGITYGVITGIYFINVLTLSKKDLSFFWWVIFSSLSYFLGVKVALNISDPLHLQATDFALAGLCGVVILTTAFNFIIRKINIIQFGVVIIAGTTLPYLLSTLSNYSSYMNDNLILIIYIVWQTLITFLLGTNYLNTQNRKSL